jgi:hypothetical protein
VISALSIKRSLINKLVFGFKNLFVLGSLNGSDGKGQAVLTIGIGIIQVFRPDQRPGLFIERQKNVLITHQQLIPLTDKKYFLIIPYL